MTLGPQFDIYGKERMSGKTMQAELHPDDGPFWDDDFRAQAADAATWPAENRYFAASPSTVGEQDGQSFHGVQGELF